MDSCFELEYKKNLLATFDKLIEIITSLNLNYFVAGGTAIGAIRHKGLIPWDDDIDICMPRKDYEELKKAFLNLNISGYELLSLNSPDSFVTYSKFINKNTTFWEFKEFKCLSGIFIDIFPLDYYSGTLDGFIKQFKYLKRLRQIQILSLSSFSLSSAIKYLKKRNIKQLRICLLSLFVPRFINGIVRRQIIKFDDSCCLLSDGDNVVSFYGSYCSKEYFKKEWFRDFVVCDFENKKVRLPICYHEYLTHLYGDYLKLPPIEKRVHEHSHYYINLKEHISLDEAQKRVEGGFTEEF